jgi:hypothetical protein
MVPLAMIVLDEFCDGVSEVTLTKQSLGNHSGVLNLRGGSVIAIGIGANTAIVSIVNRVYLNPLPYPEAELIVLFTLGQFTLAASVKVETLRFADSVGPQSDYW